MQNPLKRRVTTEIDYRVKLLILLFYVSSAAFVVGLGELAVSLVTEFFQ